MSESILHVKRAEARKVLDRMPERTFATLEAEGVIIPLRRGRRGRPSIYDLAAIVPAYIAYVTSRPGGDEREARARRDLSFAQLNELRLAERRKKLLPREQVVREGQAFVKATQAKLRALPRRMVQGGIVAADQEAAAAALIREALEEMAGWSSMLDLLKAAKEMSQ